MAEDAEDAEFTEWVEDMRLSSGLLLYRMGWNYYILVKLEHSLRDVPCRHSKRLSFEATVTVSVDSVEPCLRGSMVDGVFWWLVNRALQQKRHSKHAMYGV